MKKLLKALEFFGCVLLASVVYWPLMLVVTLIFLPIFLLLYDIIWHPMWCQGLSEDDIFAISVMMSLPVVIVFGVYKTYKEFKG